MADLRRQEDREEEEEEKKAETEEEQEGGVQGKQADALPCRQQKITIISAEPADANSCFSESSVLLPSSHPTSCSAGIQVIKEKTQEDHIIQPTAAPRRSYRTSTRTSTRTTQTDPTRSKQSEGQKPPKPPRPTPPRRTGKAGPQDSEAESECADEWSRSDAVRRDGAADWRPTPVPLPRTKSRQHTEDKDQALVHLGEVANDVASGADAESSSGYLKELQEVFREGTPGAPSLEEPSHLEMNKNPGDIRARIQAFKSQSGPEDGNLAESTKPQPLPRKTTKPPMSSKPPMAVSSQLTHTLAPYVASQALIPLVAPEPMPPLTSHDVHAQLETLPAKGGPPHPPRPVLLTSQGEEPAVPFPGRAPVKPPKELLKANLNINNHNSTSIWNHHDSHVDRPSNPPPGESASRPAVTRRPTTIRVSSQTVSESLQGNPPPLPAQKPVGSLRSTSLPKAKSSVSSPVQGSLAHKPAPSLPHGAQSRPKPRPPPAKPPPHHIQAAAPLAHPPKRIPALPPRPIPGHRLYNKYVLPRPRGITTSHVNMGQLSFQDDTPQTTDSRPGNLLKVQVLHDFTPEGPGELAVKAGDTIGMVERVDGEWYRGTFQGATGFFPVNFVKVLETSKSVPEKKKTTSCVKVSGPRCLARFDFQGANSHELTFSEGDVIQLKTYVGRDWAQGQMGVHTGIFPLNFVEVIEDLPPPTTQHDRMLLPGVADPPQAEAAKPAQAPVEWAEALYAFDAKSPDELSFKQGDCILLSEHIDGQWSRGRLEDREGIFPKAFVQTYTAGPMTLGQHAEGSSGVKGRAMYDFTSHCDEELSVQVGDVINKLESIDEEWFLGELRGKQALVPKNYVQVM
uniref:SH3 domain-containing protein 19 isoform X3 n=1 Tax=Doryrhamphus excisus TaxID=161450 RepID=UPI0025AEA511|nr:SH3 domain-containing protein 19 isoform X3 [Doryrhamphus excisus]